MIQHSLRAAEIQMKRLLMPDADAAASCIIFIILVMLTNIECETDRFSDGNWLMTIHSIDEGLFTIAAAASLLILPIFVMETLIIFEIRRFFDGNGPLSIQAFNSRPHETDATASLLILRIFVMETLIIA